MIFLPFFSHLKYCSYKYLYMHMHKNFQKTCFFNFKSTLHWLHSICLAGHFPCFSKAFYLILFFLFIFVGIIFLVSIFVSQKISVSAAVDYFSPYFRVFSLISLFLLILAHIFFGSLERFPLL